MLKIYQAETEKDLEEVKQLYTVYAGYLFEILSPYSLPFAQGLRKKALNEADNLPGKYALPEGCILVAEYKNEIAGCVALCQIAANVCELKRLYVKPQFRQKGIGRRLAETIIEKAIELKYKRMRLITNKVLFIGAKPLYSSLGFIETGHIEGSPVHNSINMQLELV